MCVPFAVHIPRSRESQHPAPPAAVRTEQMAIGGPSSRWPSGQAPLGVLHPDWNPSPHPRRRELAPSQHPAAGPAESNALLCLSLLRSPPPVSKHAESIAQTRGACLPKRVSQSAACESTRLCTSPSASREARRPCSHAEGPACVARCPSL